jgi:hypothetical protein
VERVDHRWRRGGAGGAETERSRNRDGVMRLFGPERWMECTQRGQLMPCSSMEAWVHHFQSRYGRSGRHRGANSSLFGCCSKTVFGRPTD